MPSTGDVVKITTKKGAEEGVLLPSPDKNVLIIKLQSGYNMGFEKKDVKKITVVKKAAQTRPPVKKVTKNKNLPTISILHTGGTIASKVDYRTGGVTTDFSPEELVAMFPELKNIANIESELIAQMWSDDLRFAHFPLIAKAIEKHVQKGVKGIIVGIGTDNLAVASAALSFIVESSPVPILFVGSQRSSDRGSSDAAMNLICAAEFITKTDFGGVGICMHESEDDSSCVILPAAKQQEDNICRKALYAKIVKISTQTKNGRESRLAQNSYQHVTGTICFLQGLQRPGH